MTAPPTVLGLDVSASHVVMAALDADGKTRVVPNAEGDDVTDAALHFYDESGVVVGREAAEAQFEQPDDVVLDVFGVLANPEHRTRVAGRAWSGQELAALVLRKLRDDAVALRREVSGAVLALSASVDSGQRGALLEAATLAHLPVLDTVPRSTAALIGFGLADLPAAGRLLVVDVSENAVEAALVQRTGEDLEQVGALVEPAAGRRRWLEPLSEAILTRLPVADLDDVDLGPLLRQQVEGTAIDALTRLTRHQDALLQAGAAGRRVSVDVDREKFLRDVWPLAVAIGRVARGAARLGGDRRRPDAVLLVGIGARCPGIRRALQLALDLAPVLPALPHGVVARGAAWVAAARHQLDHPGLTAVAPTPVVRGVEDEPPAHVADDAPAPRGAVISLADGGAPRPPAAPVRIVETASQTLGMLALDAEGHERVIPVIPAGARLPASFQGRFHYAYDNMTSIRVEVTEGAGLDRASVRVVGDVQLDRLPPRPRGTPIDVVWRLGEDRLLHIEVTDLETGRLGRSEISFRGALSDRERTEAAARAGRLQVG